MRGFDYSALGTGLVHASLLGSQGAIQGEKEGLKVIVAAADVIESLPFAGVTTTMAKLKGIPSKSKVLRAGLKGLRYVQDNRPGTIDVIQSWYRVEREVAGATYDLARKSYSTNGEVSEKGFCSAWSSRVPAVKFEKETSPSEIVDFNLLREIRKELAGQ